MQQRQVLRSQCPLLRFSLGMLTGASAQIGDLGIEVGDSSGEV